MAAGWTPGGKRRRKESFIAMIPQENDMFTVGRYLR